MDKSSGQKVNRETSKATDTKQQMDLTEYTHRVFYPNIKEYTFCSVPHESFLKIDPIVENNTNLYRFKRVESAPCI